MHQFFLLLSTCGEGIAKGLWSMLKGVRLRENVILPKKLQFVHVGKCGGSTISKLLHVSPVVANRYSSVYESHVDGVVVDSECDYLFCLRNPIARALSAFEWQQLYVAFASGSKYLLASAPRQRRKIRSKGVLGQRHASPQR